MNDDKKPCPLTPPPDELMGVVERVAAMAFEVITEGEARADD